MVYMQEPPPNEKMKPKHQTMSSVDSVHNTKMNARTLATRSILKFYRDIVCGHFPPFLIRKKMATKRKKVRWEQPELGMVLTPAALTIHLLLLT